MRCSRLPLSGKRGGRQGDEQIMTPLEKYAALVNACTGDEDPRLWRLTWAESLVDDLWEATESVTFEDPEAMAEALGRVHTMFALLRSVLDQTEGKEG